MVFAATTMAAVGALPAEENESSLAQAAYCDGKVIEMRFVPGKSEFRIGPWNIHTELQYDKPQNSHRNLYIVAPGTQYVAPGAEQYAHNEIVSSMPSKSDPVSWDVYFAVVLDPTLSEDFKSEQELILATQEEFVPPPEMKIDDMPGGAILKENLHVSTLADLDEHRRSNGSLPRLVIIPAKISLRASAIDPNAPEANVETRPRAAASSAAMRH